MKQILFSAMAIATLTFTACNNGNKDTHEGHDHNMPNDPAQHAATANDAAISAITPTFANVDAKAAASMNEIFNAYMHITNALSSDDASHAAASGADMAAAIGKLDKSLLTDDQKKLFDEYQSDLKENAEHINENKNEIEHQREHFAAMSEEIYALAKAFGAGRPLYRARCPMYNDNKGGIWLTESKEIKNPYFGAQMLTCGEVQEMIQ